MRNLTVEEGRVLEAQLCATNHDLLFIFDQKIQRFVVYTNNDRCTPTGTYVTIATAMATAVVRYNGILNEVRELERFLSSIGAL